MNMLARLPIAQPHAAYRIDWVLLTLWLAIMSAGLIMISSASMFFAETTYGDGWYFTERHLIWVGLSIPPMLIVSMIPVQFWRTYGGWLLVLSIVLLLLVLVPGIGRRVNGSQRWLQLGPLTFQASEAVKFFAILYFASYLSRRTEELQNTWRGFLKPMAVVGLLGGLMLLEPDFGSTVVLLATVVSMLFVAGIKLGHFFLLIVAAGSSMAAMAMMSPYRMQRLITYLDPWSDMFNSGYQLTQSLIAFGRGQWLGMGLGHSIQKLFYLPEAHTDFIYAVIAEEFGLVGGLLIMALLGGLIFRLFRMAREAIDKDQLFSGLVVFGVAIMFACQALINVGVSSGFLPTKGLTLPFISYGGSSLLVCCSLMMLVMRVYWELSVIPMPVKSQKVAAKASPPRRTLRQEVSHV